MSVLEECYKSGCLTALDIVEVNLDLVAEEFRRKQVWQLTQFLSDVFFTSRRLGHREGHEGFFSWDVCPLRTSLK